METKIHQILGLNTPLSGDVGIEVEMEGKALPREVGMYWQVKADNSLRGGAEYVLLEPSSLDTLSDKMKVLWGAFAEEQSVLEPSHRCSTHVHINIQDLTEIQVFNFMVLYLICEDALVRFCGDERVGNLFCLRARDAETVVDTIESVVRTRDWDYFNTDRIRYAAMNCSSILRFGSLEFRSMRGVTDPRLVVRWANLLCKIKEASKTYKKPSDILNGFSEGGQEAFCYELFGKYSRHLFNYAGWEDEITESMRRVQCIAYSGDWDMFLFEREEEEELWDDEEDED